MFNFEEALEELKTLNRYIVEARREVKLFEEIYCSSESLGVINSSLTTVFSIIQRSMFSSILTKVSAIFDSKSFGRFDNLSLSFVEHKYRVHLSESSRRLFQDLQDRFECHNIKDFRNKLVAHNDRGTILGESEVMHQIGRGDLVRLLTDARSFCISVSEDLPGTLENALKVVPWEMRQGDDGKELIRRVALGAKT